MKVQIRALLVVSLALGVRVVITHHRDDDGLAVVGPTAAVAQGTTTNPDPNFAPSNDAAAGRYVVTFAPGSYTMPDSPSAGLDGPSVPSTSSYSVVVEPSDSPDATTAAGAICGTYGASLDATFAYIGSFSMVASESVARSLSHDPRGVCVEADSSVYATSVEASPGWGLDRIDQWNNVDANAGPPNNQFTYFGTGSGVDAFVVDTGIAPDCAGLGNSSRVVQDFTAFEKTVNGRKVPDFADDVSHGTGVAGVIGGTQYGVAKGVRLRPIKVLKLNPATGGGKGSVSDLLKGLDYAKKHLVSGRPAVLNMSLIFYNTSSNDTKSIKSAIDKLVDKRVVVVAAAGNQRVNASLGLPGGYSSKGHHGRCDGLERRDRPISLPERSGFQLGKRRGRLRTRQECAGLQRRDKSEW